MDRSPDFHKRGGGKLAHDRRFVSNSLVESFFGISAILFEGGEGGVEMFQRSRGMRLEHVEKNKFSG